MIQQKTHLLDSKSYLKGLEIKGEKITSYFRWLFTTIIATILILYYKEHSINSGNIYFTSFVLTPAFYNAILSYFLYKGIYKPYMKYVSVFMDVSLVSTGIFISSYAFSLLYPVTAPTILVYSVILVLCITRIDKIFMIVSTMYVLLSFNIVYLLWFKLFSKSVDYAMIMYLGYTHREQIIKSIFIVILGFISSYTISMIKKFIYSSIEANAKAKNAELRLVKQYKIILNNLNIGIAIIDINNTVIFINQTLIDMLGFKKEDIIGKNLIDLIIPGEKNRNKRIFELFRKKIESKKHVFIKLSLTSKKSEPIPVQIYITTTYILNDPAYLLTISDLRKQKALEERLLQSKKMETIGRMASGFAHDFNNLISIINESLYEVIENEEMLNMELIHRINSIINRQKELVELLYKISGKIQVEEVNLSVQSLFSKLINLLSPILPQNIYLRMNSFIEDDAMFTINETAILQIIFNLILNAKEAIEPAPGNIEVSATITKEYDRANAILVPQYKKNQNYLKITVRDDGPGIPSTMLNRIFDPYISTKSAKNNQRRGVGLSFVYTITEQLKGGISVKTKKGEGTTFKIYIPVKIAKKSNMGKSEEKQLDNIDIKSNIKNNEKSRAKILYIDDDEDMRSITSRILNRHGFIVKAAKSGLDALQLLKNDRYNLIMTDFYLPDIEGDRLVLELREHSNIPIILITGAQTESIEKIEGVHAVIKKPIEVDALIKTINRVVKP